MSCAEFAVTAAGTGPAVVWVHGYTMDSQVWQDIWPMLPGFRHVGVDLPGHGRSGPSEPDTTLSQLADRLAEVMQRERAARLVALSMGTMVAFELVIRRLHPVARLAVVAPALVGMPPAVGAAERYRQLAARRRAGASNEQLTDLWMSAPPDIFAGIAERPDRRARLREVVLQHRWSELDFGGPAAFYRLPQRIEELPGSAEQLLVISGDRDMPEFRGLGATLAARLPGARLARCPQAGHLPLLEIPEHIVPLLAAFLAA